MTAAVRFIVEEANVEEKARCCASHLRLIPTTTGVLDNCLLLDLPFTSPTILTISMYIGGLCLTRTID